jgi:hypothetical protein
MDSDGYRYLVFLLEKLDGRGGISSPSTPMAEIISEYISFKQVAISLN